MHCHSYCQRHRKSCIDMPFDFIIFVWEPERPHKLPPLNVDEVGLTEGEVRPRQVMAGVCHCQHDKSGVAIAKALAISCSFSTP